VGPVVGEWDLPGLGLGCQAGVGLTGARARLSWRGARARAVLLVAVLLKRLTLTAACTSRKARVRSVETVCDS